jgi:hypothetical protein
MYYRDIEIGVVFNGNWPVQKKEGLQNQPAAINIF